MRSTLEIIIAVKECQPATDEELRLALIAMCNMEHFVRRDLESLADAVIAGQPSAMLRAASAKKTLDAMFYARKKSPAEWLGPEHTPGTPEFQRFYEAGKRLLEKIEGQQP